MARIEIKLPTNFSFSTNIPIRISDINRGIHVSYAAILNILSEARAQFLATRDCEDQEIIKDGVGFIIADLGIIYKNQARYGQTLKVEIAAVEVTRKSFDLIYQITDSQTGMEIVRAKTALLSFNFNKQETIPISEEIFNRLIK